ncbi:MULTISPECIES: hypothetical protein [Streptomyces]|uniref:hypothetical protein n=1 Tax=Streptomyces TaxID=1883 RepID=UPI0029A062F3|nr:MULTISPECIES: hypothetical protein [unclassified Streptomyces]MDX3087376.1 hypothetical protein [Streptomyces sp. ME12-02E]MDX3332808.1 hypothetical protein [Streptomyces sp. ME02-6978a]
MLPLPEVCARVLDERRELQALERRIAGEHWSQEPDHDLVFSSEHGGMIDPVGEAVGMLAELLEDPLIG